MPVGGIGIGVHPQLGQTPAASEPPFVGPYDPFTSGLQAIYSLRRTLGSYTGAAIRVREDADDNESDIGFNADGTLDVTALEGLIGPEGSGFVVTWYDQSGNARHVTQATDAAQPRIADAGVVDTGIRFADVADSRLERSSTAATNATNTQSIATWAWYFPTASITGCFVSNGGSTPGPNAFELSLAGGRPFFGVESEAAFAIRGAAPDVDEWHSVFGQWNHTGNEISVSVDNDTANTSAGASIAESPATDRVGAATNGSSWFPVSGSFAELAVWNTTLSAGTQTALQAIGNPVVA